jgi:hypothetical protein
MYRERVSKDMSTYTSHGNTSAERNSGRNLTLKERDLRALRRIVSKNHTTTAAEMTGQQNWIFIWKHLFPRELSDMSFSNPTSTVGLQLPNLWLLKVMLRFVNDGVWTIKPGHQTIGNVRAICSDESSFTLFRKTGRIYKYVWRTPKAAYNPECLVWTRGRFCDSFGSNIVVQYSVGPIITLRFRITAREYVDRSGNQVHHTIQTFPNSNTVFQDGNAPFTQRELFSHGLKNFEMNVNIFLSQYNHQIWTSLDHCGQFWRLEWGTDSHLQYL